MDSREELNIEGHSTSKKNQQPRTKVCGMCGNPATQQLCSLCFQDFMKKIRDKVKNHDKDWAIISPSTNPFPCFARFREANKATQTTKNNRCHTCNKKVRLMGFSCRCRGMFCSLHRYPEEHACKFDFKTQARIALAKQNPLCIADKLDYRL